MPIHVAQKPADIFAGKIGFQRPGCIRVAEGGGEIRHAAEHHPLVAHCRGQIYARTVDADLETAEQLHLQARRGDDDVGLEFLTRLQPYSILREALDMIGDDRHAPGVDLAEEIAVRHEAETLIPGIVARREMGRDVVVRPELLAD